MMSDNDYYLDVVILLLGCTNLRLYENTRLNDTSTIFTLSIGTPYLPPILVLKYEIVHSTTS